MIYSGCSADIMRSGGVFNKLVASPPVLLHKALDLREIHLHLEVKSKVFQRAHFRSVFLHLSRPALHCNDFYVPYECSFEYKKDPSDFVGSHSVVLVLCHTINIICFPFHLYYLHCSL